MHEYMRAIGFSHGFSREGFKRLLSNVVYEADESRTVSADDGILLIEYRKFYGKNVGLIVRGTMEPAEDEKMKCISMKPFRF